MTKADLINAIAEKSELSKKDSEKALSILPAIAFFYPNIALIFVCFLNEESCWSCMKSHRIGNFYRFRCHKHSLLFAQIYKQPRFYNVILPYAQKNFNP